jgi:hypothetical protein
VPGLRDAALGRWAAGGDSRARFGEAHPFEVSAGGEAVDDGGDQAEAAPALRRRFASEPAAKTVMKQAKGKAAKVGVRAEGYVEVPSETAITSSAGESKPLNLWMQQVAGSKQQCRLVMPTRG